ncbi:kinase-like domain-containing protein [Hyaloraphidium curvatum]|nr:kinase-like domain-containing protein [Hyaloraphidium curvatum]
MHAPSRSDSLPHPAAQHRSPSPARAATDPSLPAPGGPGMLSPAGEWAPWAKPRNRRGSIASLNSGVSGASAAPSQAAAAGSPLAGPQPGNRTPSPARPAPAPPPSAVCSAGEEADPARYPVDPTPDELAALYLRGKNRRKANYRDLKILGRGSEGTVKLALKVDTNEKVALKSMPKPNLPAGNPKSFTSSKQAEYDSRIKFERDIRRRYFAMRSHNGHPHLPRYLDMLETKEKFYIVTAICHGGTLQSYVAKNGGLMEEEDALYVVTILLRTLAYIHEHGITHRDLKPSNVFLREPDRLESMCIADFAGAFIDHDRSLAPSATRPELGTDSPLFPVVPTADPKAMKTITGTPFYLAPEIVQGKRYDSKVDMWSLGCIAYELLYGATPFQSCGSFDELFGRIARAAYEIPRDASLKVSDAAANFVRELLVPDPSHRPSAADALRHPWILGDGAPRRGRMRSGVQVFWREGGLETAVPASVGWAAGWTRPIADASGRPVPDAVLSARTTPRRATSSCCTEGDGELRAVPGPDGWFAAWVRRGRYTDAKVVGPADSPALPVLLRDTVGCGLGDRAVERDPALPRLCPDSADGDISPCRSASPATLGGSPAVDGKWTRFPRFPPALLENLIETMLFCFYGQCRHPTCLHALPPLLVPSPAEREPHLLRASPESDRLRLYLARLLILLPVGPGHVEIAADYVRRLRRRLDALPAPTPQFSRTWKSHYLVLLVALVLARKFADDGAAPRMSRWAEAGGFRKEVLVQAEREMLDMLGWELS